METCDSLQSDVGTTRLAGSSFSSSKDFMILCPAVAENSGAIEALYALYYLPQNYKLLITSIGVKSVELFEHIRDIIKSDALKNRVVIHDRAGMSKMAAPFSDANVVVYGSSDPMYTKDAPQAIVVFDIASKLKSLNGKHNFAVASRAPESVASAILKVARNQR